ncbi:MULTISPECIES: PaaI family thioesterase [Aequorivita]|uniref:Medium/long-chain acyl-CoA thioesterase YigI n=1 Tax=Aequorivita iocasae TaxID=2803865 RepID=A0ABX7DVF5_9FLAO|nr:MULTISPECIES: PaaI family thioesterase [Aequorivita]QQX78125.1 PaaI family thioesterase [Aequorivita iocasae]UCA57638.1 PaaI family thioesterase [Aequorivita sp. F7]
MDNARNKRLLESFERSEIMKHFGAEASIISDGYFEITVSKQNFMVRPAGMFNGSTIATLVDISSGYAAASATRQNSYFTTVELKINYLNPALGDKLIARAQVIKNGKRLSVVRSDVFSIQVKGEALVATSLVTLMQLQNRNNETQID